MTLALIIQKIAGIKKSDLSREILDPNFNFLAILQA